MALLDLADIPEEVGSFEALAVWCLSRLARLAQGRRFPIGEGGALVPACSVVVIEAADGRTYARLEAAIPCSLPDLNGAGSGSWMSAGALVGSAPAAGAEPPPPPPPPPPVFDPVSFGPLDAWDLAKTATVQVIDGKVAAVANLVSGRPALQQPDANLRPAWTLDAGDGAPAAVWGTEANIFSLFHQTGFTWREAYILAKGNIPNGAFPRYMGLISYRNKSGQGWILTNQGDCRLWPYSTVTTVYLNANDTVNRAGSMCPDIGSWTLIRAVLGSPGATSSDGLNLGIDRWPGDFVQRGWQGMIRFCAFFAEPLPEADRQGFYEGLLDMI